MDIGIGDGLAPPYLQDLGNARYRISQLAVSDRGESQFHCVYELLPCDFEIAVAPKLCHDVASRNFHILEAKRSGRFPPVETLSLV
jgi:hypothetical protein